MLEIGRRAAKRTALLLATTVLALMAAGGIALAATFTCSTNPCEGTTDDDVITGTVGAEIINGKAGNDEISGLDANDTLNGEDGNDTVHGELGEDQLNGGAGNDTMNGGEGNDSYNFINSWGADSIPADPSGTDTLDFSAITTPPVIVQPGQLDGVNYDLAGPDSACSVNATHCLALGGTFIENAVGTGFNDRLTGNASSNKIGGGDGGDDLYGGDGDDDLIGGNGDDWLFGEAGNDELNAGSSSDPDYYVFGPNWGSDTITDGGGNADEVRGNSPSLDNPPVGTLKVNLVSSDTSAEFTNGTDRVDWTGSVIDRAVTGPGNDEISQRPGQNDSMFARGGSDTYKGYEPNASAGFDLIHDGVRDSALDRLDLASFNLSNASWSTQAGTTGNIRHLVIGFDSGGRVTLGTYFGNTSTDVCTSGLGPGLIETIAFADDPSVDFAQVKSLLGCPSPDTTPPTIDGTSPVNDATGIAPTATVSATFSENMDQGTLTTSTFMLTKQGFSTPVGATVSYDPTTKKALLDPSSDLASNTAYTATIKGGSTGVKDTASNALAQDHTWTFTTAAPPAPSCTLSGTADAETISGTPGDDIICAGGGNDTVKGLGGNDTLKGEAGNDKLLGGLGNDALDGGLGTDTASYSASLTAVIASLATNSSTGEGSDTFLGLENLLGSSKADTLNGSAANNTLTGRGGNDTERGGAGNDKVIGSGGADFLYGEDGADAVTSKDGVTGNDSLDGGTGTDTKVTDATEKSVVGFP